MIKTELDVGTKIRCVDTLGYNFLTKGKVYEVWETSTGGFYFLDDDKDAIACFYDDCQKFELVEEPEESKEEEMNKENLFKVGDVVYDVLYGKGKVISIHGNCIVGYPIQVKFSKEVMDALSEEVLDFTQDGKLNTIANRTLFFSEPKIEALTERPFVSTLVGKRIAVKEHGCECYVVDVVDETVERIKFWVVANSIKPYEVDKSKIEAIYEVSSENLLTKK